MAHPVDVAEVWPVESSSDLYRSKLPFALRADEVRRPGHPDDESRTRVVLEHPGAVVVLAVDDDGRVLCLRQYRHPVGHRLIELPAGLLDKEGEEPQVAAERELVEETGTRAGSWTHLGSAYSSPGISAELIHYFTARDLSPADRGDFVAEHEEADMEVLWVPFADLLDAVLAGRVADAPLLVAVLLAQAKGAVIR